MRLNHDVDPDDFAAPAAPAAPPPAAPAAHLDAVAAHVDALAALARDAELRERSLADQRAATERADVQRVQRVQDAREAPTGPDTLDQELTALAAFRERRSTWIAALGVRHRRTLRDTVQNAALASAPVLDVAARREMQSAAQRRREALGKSLTGLQSELTNAEEELTRARARYGVAGRKIAAKTAQVPSEPEEALKAIRTQLGWIAAKRDQAVGQSGTVLCRTLVIVALSILIVAPHAVGIWGFLTVLKKPDAALNVVISGAACALVLTAVVVLLRLRLGRALAGLAGELAGLRAALDPVETRIGTVVDPATFMQQQVGQVLHQDAQRAAQQAAFQAAYGKAAAASKAREAALQQRLVTRMTAAEAAAQRRSHARGAGRMAELDAELAAAQRDSTAHREAAAAELDRARAALRSNLAAWQADGDRLAAREMARLGERHPPLTRAMAADFPLAATWGDAVPIGTLTATLTELAAAIGFPQLSLPQLPSPEYTLRIPAALAFPALGSLLVRVSPNGRDAGLRLLGMAALRTLVAFPPGRVKVTLIDPVGLGQSFPRLLDLGEHDDAVLAGGVLAEPNRIERGLDDLCAHLEKVIQKHLRGRYATLDDYNREAGDLQEPMRLVLIADFPAGFGERALDRLAALLRSGARCGVHLFVLHDDRQALPAALDLAFFRRTGLVVREVRTGDSISTSMASPAPRFLIERDGLHAFALIPESEPAADVVHTLLRRIGSAAVAGKRVAVPFSLIAPAADAVWSVSTADRLRLPIGTSGPDRVQYLELGKGTAQHVLVGGRTGSGKSTLFHVLIASASLWCHPRELQLHLIDFKKGVEFKAYATHRLPHAQVVAIESDREFGLAVLRQLDAELIRRGDLFRAVGAQDLAAHRRAAAAAHSSAAAADAAVPYLPRVLLIIDEFQELFTEDDAIARDAALLLDRFVRQGRAFGVHVILGSQTLGGSYSLAKSSLGQMGVRIVLPCNETDANLLLHEDNDGARLLTRPGDAIYNDQAGLKDGNSPFQVCWLSDRDEAAHLIALRERATQQAWKNDRQIIFEGDGPSRLDDEAELSALAERPVRAATARVSAFLGQASSLRGSASVTLPAAAGGNLVLIGQHREAGVATLAAVLISLACRYRPDAGNDSASSNADISGAQLSNAEGPSIRLVILDGEDSDGPCAGMHARLTRHLPHRIERHETRDAAQLIAELAAELARRQSGSAKSHAPIVLCVSALQRLRVLRQDDDAGFGGKASPAETFAALLANGPEYGLHVVVWCDALAALQRTLGRRALRDFEQRIAFQMSASDSTEMLDDDAASRLGLHTALLSVQGEGRREKFRPYRLPDDAYLATLGAALRGR